ncbi:MAG: hypothetical protein ABJ327_13255 [Litoreibacter sp.]
MLNVSLGIGTLTHSYDGPPLANIVVSSSPTIVESPTQSGLLILNGPVVSSPNEVILSVLWLRDGAPQSGQMSSSFGISPTDPGANFQALVQISAPGYAPKAVYSDVFNWEVSAWQISAETVLSAPAPPSQPTVVGFFIEV